MTIGSLALVGFPLTAGWYSKDAIIEAAYASTRTGHFYAYILTTIAVFLTSFYSFRLVFLTFFGAPRWEVAHAHADNTGITDAHGPKAHLEPTNRPETGGHDHVTADHPDAAAAHDVKLHPDHVATEGHDFVPHESPNTMLVPLYVLSVGALFAGMFFAGHFIGDQQAGFWKGALYYGPDNHILEQMERVPFLVKQLPLLLLVCGFALAWFGYVYDLGAPARWARGNPALYSFLSHKWYFDELYDAVFVKGAKALGDLFWKGGDQTLIDGLGPNGVAAVSSAIGRGTGRAQTGYVYHYAFVMLLGVAGLLSYALWAFG
jgi:NADH-quinone oxidoreductase subunit L